MRPLRRGSRLPNCGSSRVTLPSRRLPDSRPSLISSPLHRFFPHPFSGFPASAVPSPAFFACAGAALHISISRSHSDRKTKSHLIPASQVFPAPIQRFPRLGRAVASILRVCRCGVTYFDFQIPFRSQDQVSSHPRFTGFSRTHSAVSPPRPCRRQHSSRVQVRRYIFRFPDPIPLSPSTSLLPGIVGAAVL